MTSDMNSWKLILFVSLLSGCTHHAKSPATIPTSRESTGDTLTEFDNPSLTSDSTGKEHFFTNLNIVVWVPNQGAHINDGPTTTVKVDEISPPGAFVKDYRIQLEIRSIQTERQFRQHLEWAISDWYYQEHLNLSTKKGQIGERIRKDIWNPQKNRKLFIYATVKPGSQFTEDFNLTKKMVESVRLVPN